MLLNYKTQGNGEPLLLIHGLFGNLDNLGRLANQFEQDYQVISIDLRNHGLSFHSDAHDYPLLATDVIHLMNHLSIDSAHIIGHSMGGKVAMMMASIAPKKIQSLSILDMAPIAYQHRKHDDVFSGLFQLTNTPPTNRKEADDLLASSISMPSVRQFLIKSLYKKETHLALHFNLPALFANYDKIIGWKDIPPFKGKVLFIKGEQSDYILAEHQKAIITQFPNAKAHIVNGVGHWLHAEKPAIICRIINKFIKK